jgi:hypothetical protein
MALYIITTKDFGETNVAGVFTNLTELSKGLDLVAKLNEAHEDDCKGEMQEELPCYADLVKMFKTRTKHDKIESLDYYVYQNSNNEKSIKISCVSAKNLVMSF